MSKDIIKTAYDELSKISQDLNAFRMCIPARKDDSDVIIASALQYAREMEAQLEKKDELLKESFKHLTRVFEGGVVEYRQLDKLLEKLKEKEGK